MDYQWDFGPVLRNLPLFLEGLAQTVRLSATAIAGGLAVGLALALMRLSGRRWLAWPAVAVIEFFRSTPPLVHLFWVFYALPILAGISLTPFLAAAIALSVQSGAFFAEVYRAGIVSVERGQWEAGRALGMRRGALMRRIVLPQALRRMVAPFVERAFELVKTTALAATLSYGELLYQAMVVVSRSFRPLEVYTAVAVIFFVLLFSASLVMRWVEARLSRGERR
ncbi:MAG: amino acid ABC transporter permease [Alphaproteobacteria bacterium]|nr:amino acid ABC transporter permease [Alphaproteobacteria bacterium]